MPWPTSTCSQLASSNRSSGSRNSRPSVPTAGDEVQGAWFGQGLAFQIGHQLGDGFVLADEPAAEDVAVARPVLQGDPPLPAGAAGYGLGVGTRRPDIGRGHGDRAVTGQ